MIRQQQLSLGSAPLEVNRPDRAYPRLSLAGMGRHLAIQIKTAERGVVHRHTPATATTATSPPSRSAVPDGWERDSDRVSQLQLHRETRQLPAIVLRAPGTLPALKPADPEPSASILPSIWALPAVIRTNPPPE